MPRADAPLPTRAPLAATEEIAATAIGCPEIDLGWPDLLSHDEEEDDDEVASTSATNARVRRARPSMRMIS